jgi:hypothetical protein
VGARGDPVGVPPRPRPLEGSSPPLPRLEAAPLEDSGTGGGPTTAGIGGGPLTAGGGGPALGCGAIGGGGLVCTLMSSSLDSSLRGGGAGAARLLAGLTGGSLILVSS